MAISNSFLVTMREDCGLHIRDMCEARQLHHLRGGARACRVKGSGGERSPHFPTWAVTAAIRFSATVIVGKQLAT